MKFRKEVDNTLLQDAIKNIALEMQSLREKIGEGISSNDSSNESVVAELRDGNDIMRSILSVLNDIASDMKDSNKPWYSRAFCG